MFGDLLQPRTGVYDDRVTESTDKTGIERFMREVGARAKGAGRIYITGGGSAVLRGWRETTIDIDVRMDPEPAGVFEAIPDIKRNLRLNIELASPQDFLPAIPGWEERSIPIAREGRIDFYHYDFVSQALSKLERGHEKDLRDVQSMLDDRLVDESAIRTAFDGIRSRMIRYPHLDPDALQAKIDGFFGDSDD